MQAAGGAIIGTERGIGRNSRADSRKESDLNRDTLTKFDKMNQIARRSSTGGKARHPVALPEKKQIVMDRGDPISASLKKRESRGEL